MGKKHSQGQYPNTQNATSTTASLSVSAWVWCFPNGVIINIIWVLQNCSARTRAECCHGREWYWEKYPQASKQLIQSFSVTCGSTQTGISPCTYFKADEICVEVLSVRKYSLEKLNKSSKWSSSQSIWMCFQWLLYSAAIVLCLLSIRSFSSMT